MNANCKAPASVPGPGMIGRQRSDDGQGLWLQRQHTSRTAFCAAPTRTSFWLNRIYPKAHYGPLNSATRSQVPAAFRPDSLPGRGRRISRNCVESQISSLAKVCLRLCAIGCVTICCQLPPQTWSCASLFSLHVSHRTRKCAVPGHESAVSKAMFCGFCCAPLPCVRPSALSE